VYAGNRIKNHIHIKLCTISTVFDLMSEDIQQDLGIRTGIDMTQILPKHLALELRSIGQVAIVPKHNAKRGIDIKRLRFCCGRGAGGRVTHMCNAGISDQTPHVSGLKNVLHKTIVFMHIKGITITSHDARSILTTMLQYQQAIIEQLIDRVFANDADDSTHDCHLNAKKT
jgi:hypothetical protein